MEKIVAISTDGLYRLIHAGEKDGNVLVVRNDMPDSRPMPIGSFLAHNPGYWEVQAGY